MKKIGDIHKFSFSEMMSNNTGKTSVTSFCGWLMIVVGCFGFICGIFDKMFFNNTIDIINQSIIFATMGATLIGVKNVTGAKNQLALNEAEKINEINNEQSS